MTPSSSAPDRAYHALGCSLTILLIVLWSAVFYAIYWAWRFLF